MTRHVFQVITFSQQEDTDMEVTTRATVTVDIDNPALKASDISSGLCDGFSSMLESRYDGVDGWSTDVEVMTLKKPIIGQKKKTKKKAKPIPTQAAAPGGSGEWKAYD